VSYTLAHLSDWHVTSLEGWATTDIMSKRLLGWLSWHSRRKGRHQAEVLRALFEDVKRQAPDHVAVTGDLTNLALAREFEIAAELLGELGPPDWVSVVPGNHDAYVPMPGSTTWDRWAEYMASDPTDLATERGPVPLPAPTHEEFPTVRIRGPVALVGLCSAVPTPLGHASGCLGERQLEAVASRLTELRNKELCRVVLIHHPVVDHGFTPRRRLVDSSDFRTVLRAAGADLVLHGHGHRSIYNEIEGPDGPIPVVGVRSSSHSAQDESRRARYHLFRIEPGGAGRYRFHLAIRGYDAARGGFVAEGEEVL